MFTMAQSSFLLQNNHNKPTEYTIKLVTSHINNKSLTFKVSKDYEREKEE